MYHAGLNAKKYTKINKDVSAITDSAQGKYSDSANWMALWKNRTSW